MAVTSLVMIALIQVFREQIMNNNEQLLNEIEHYYKIQRKWRANILIIRLDTPFTPLMCIVILK